MVKIKLALNYSFYSGGAALLGRSDNVNKEICTTSFISRQSSFLFLWLSGPRRQFPGRESILGKTINKMKCLCIDLIFCSTVSIRFSNGLLQLPEDLHQCSASSKRSTIFTLSQFWEKGFCPHEYDFRQQLPNLWVLLFRNVCGIYTPLPSTITLAHPPSPGPAYLTKC